MNFTSMKGYMDDLKLKIDDINDFTTMHTYLNDLILNIYDKDKNNNFISKDTGNPITLNESIADMDNLNTQIKAANNVPDSPNCKDTFISDDTSKPIMNKSNTDCMNTYISMETGEPITLDDSIKEMDDLINRMNNAKNVDSPKCIITLVSLITGYKSRGPVITLDKARAYFTNPKLQIGSSWTDRGTIYTIVEP